MRYLQWRVKSIIRQEAHERPSDLLLGIGIENQLQAMTQLI